MEERRIKARDSRKETISQKYPGGMREMMLQSKVDNSNKQCKECGTKENLRTCNLGRVYNICKECYSKGATLSNKKKYELDPTLGKKCTRNCVAGVKNKIAKVGYLVPPENRLVGDKNNSKLEVSRTKIRNSGYRLAGGWQRTKTEDEIRDILKKRYCPKPQAELFTLVNSIFSDVSDNSFLTIF